MRPRVAGRPGVVVLVFAAALPLALMGRPEDVRGWLNTGIPADDAFYYLKIARNLVESLGSTFDGLHRTSGYQPLWLWTLVPLAWAVHGPEAFLCAATLLQAALAAAALALLAWPRKEGPTWRHVLPVLILACTERFWRLALDGLETALLLLCLAWTWLAMRRAWRSDWRRPDALALGVALALTCLARTDAMILATVTVIAGAWWLRRRPGDLAALVIPPALIVGTYLLWNRFSFGEWMPISGAVKHAYAEYQLREAAGGGSALGLRMRYLVWPLQPGDRAVLTLVLLDAGVALVAWRKRNPPLALLAGAMVLKYGVYALFFYNHAEYPWYYAPDLLVPVVALQTWLPRAHARLATFLLAAATVVAATRMVGERRGFLARQAADPSPRSELGVFYATALLLNLDPHADRTCIAMHNAGVFGFFYRGRTLNLDGLVNDAERLAAIRRDGYDFYPYLRRLLGREKVDGYTDYIPRQNLATYDRRMPTLGFRPLALEPLLRAQGAWWHEGPGTQRLYGRHPLGSMGWEPSAADSAEGRRPPAADAHPVTGASRDRTGAARPALVSGHAATFALETGGHAP